MEVGVMIYHVEKNLPASILNSNMFSSEVAMIED